MPPDWIDWTRSSFVSRFVDFVACGFIYWLDNGALAAEVNGSGQRILLPILLRVYMGILIYCSDGWFKRIPRYPPKFYELGEKAPNLLAYKDWAASIFPFWESCVLFIPFLIVTLDAYPCKRPSMLINFPDSFVLLKGDRGDLEPLRPSCKFFHLPKLPCVWSILCLPVFSPLCTLFWFVNRLVAVACDPCAVAMLRHPLLFVGAVWGLAYDLLAALPSFSSCCEPWLPMVFWVGSTTKVPLPWDLLGLSF